MDGPKTYDGKRVVIWLAVVVVVGVAVLVALLFLLRPEGVTRVPAPAPPTTGAGLSPATGEAVTRPTVRSAGLEPAHP